MGLMASPLEEDSSAWQPAYASKRSQFLQAQLRITAAPEAQVTQVTQDGSASAAVHPKEQHGLYCVRTMRHATPNTYRYHYYPTPPHTAAPAPVR